MVYKRHLRKSIDRILKVLAMTVGLTIAMINDFDGWAGLKFILGMVAMELILITIISIYGRND